MSRYTNTVILDGQKIRKSMDTMGITQTALCDSIGISTSTMNNVLTEKKTSVETENKITKGLFQRPGYFRKAMKEETTIKKTDKKDKTVKEITSTKENDLEDILSMLDDVKCSNELILSQLKTQTTILARLLALWEGDKDEKKFAFVK